MFALLGAKAALGFMGAVLLASSMSGCGGGASQVTSTDNKLSNTAHTALLDEAKAATGFKELTASEEMHNLLTRITRQNDPNHISYLYLFLPGVPYPVHHFVIRGKCTSTDSQAVSPEQPQGSDSNNNPTVVTSAAQLDGSYGVNEAGIFCFEDNAARTMITWSGEYFQSDSLVDFGHDPLRVTMDSKP